MKKIQLRVGGWMSRRGVALRVVGMRIETPSPALRLVRNFPLAIALVTLAMVALPAAFAQGPGWVGLSSVRSQYFVNEDLLFYVPETLDAFGAALATGDFNGDGADDLATGIPYDNGLAGFELDNMGIVVVRYGVAGFGLESGLADTVLSKYNGAFWDPVEGDRFGYALAAGDFNGDGYDDLAVGAPGNGPGCSGTCPGDYGMVFIYYGSSSGIGLAWLHWIGDGHGGWGAAPSDRFGTVLAAGNFNGDTFDDLAIGAPNYSYGILNPSRPAAGGVWVVEGGPAGMPTPQSMFFIGQIDAGIPEDSESGDQFGFSLAVGNFNGDTQSIGNEVYDFDDLAIGIPGEDGVGAVLILYGSQWNLLFGSSVFLGEWDLSGSPETGSLFGFSLAAADFDGNGADDLAIGAPNRDVGTRTDTGMVTVLYGQMFAGFDFGLTEWWSQAAIYGNGFARDFDHFGLALAGLRFDPHWDAVGEPFGISTLVIGTPGMNTYQGGFSVLRGTTAGLGPAHKSKLFGPDFGALPDIFQENQSFGAVFATGDFDGNGYEDLAIGHQQRTVDGLPFAGAELILYSSTFGDGFEAEHVWDWSSATP